MRKLKISHKALMFVEASYIYCNRHGIDYDSITDDEFIILLDTDKTNEFDNICKDLRCYRHCEKYTLIEITEDEYDMCVDKFGDETKI